MSSLREISSFSKDICTSYVEWFFGKKVNKLKERIKYSPDTNSSLLILSCSKGDVPCPPFFARGSITIEAALVVPLFLFACIMILSIIDVMRVSMNNEAKIHKLTREAVVYGYFAEEVISGKEGDYINISLSYPVSLPIKAFGLKNVTVKNHCYAHIFNGYDDKAGDRVGETQEYVYITEKGSVYHRKRSCSHLNVSVREVAGKDVAKERNEDGSIYYACKKCVKSVSDYKPKSNETVYITDYGVQFHLRINCSNLKRTVQVVSFSDAEGKTPCKKCGS